MRKLCGVLQHSQPSILDDIIHADIQDGFLHLFTSVPHLCVTSLIVSNYVNYYRYII